MIFHKRAFVLSLVLSLLSIASASAADTILLHGHIYTSNPKVPWAQAMAIAATRIEAMGSDQEIAPLQKAGTTVIDLHGRTVIPGISDSHTHMWFGSIALRGVNLSTPEASITPDNPEYWTLRRVHSQFLKMPRTKSFVSFWLLKWLSAP